MNKQRFYFDFGEVTGDVDAEPSVAAIVQEIWDYYGDLLRKRLPAFGSTVGLFESLKYASAYPYSEGHMVALPNKCCLEETKPLAEYLALLQ